MKAGWIALQDQNGIAYVLTEKIVAVSGAFQKRGGEPSRRLILADTPVMVYILDSPENAVALGFEPDGWGDYEAPAAPKIKRPRKPVARSGRWPRRAPTVDPNWTPPQ